MASSPSLLLFLCSDWKYRRCTKCPRKNEQVRAGLAAPIDWVRPRLLLIGTYWLLHHAIFHYLTHATRIFVGLNGLFLFSLSFLPFPTGLQAVYRDDELAMVLYSVLSFSAAFRFWRFGCTPSGIIASLIRRHRQSLCGA